jgi:hypothetical protein
LPTAGALEELVDPSPQLNLKIAAAGKFQGLVMRSGSCALVRIARLKFFCVCHRWHPGILRDLCRTRLSVLLRSDALAITSW